jgi:hypothetical protein
MFPNGLGIQVDISLQRILDGKEKSPLSAKGSGFFMGLIFP